jgi:predicted transcriptional regulator
MATSRFGRMQYRIMRILWDCQKASAREITDALNKEVKVAHSTVQTLLRRLEGKGAVKHEVEAKTFVFYPLIDELTARRLATRELVDRAFDGSIAELAAHLFENGKITKAELAQVRKLLEEETR